MENEESIHGENLQFLARFSTVFERDGFTDEIGLRSTAPASRASFDYFALKGLDEASQSVVRITGRAIFGYAEVVLPDAEAEEGAEDF